MKKYRDLVQNSFAFLTSLYKNTYLKASFKTIQSKRLSLWAFSILYRRIIYSSRCKTHYNNHFYR